LDSCFQIKQDIQNRYRCTQCSSNGYCFKKINHSTGKEQHFDIDPKLLTLWAAEVDQSRATIYYPPCNIKEFDELLNSDSKRKTKSSRTVSNDDSNPNSAPHITYNFAPGPVPYTPPRRQAIDSHSPVRGVDPADYDGPGLKMFLDWCAKKYKDPEFSEIYSKLKEKRNGVDIIKGNKEAEAIAKECNILPALCTRLKESFSSWERERMVCSFLQTYNGTLHLRN
jgi:hypothetical protein